MSPLKIIEETVYPEWYTLERDTEKTIKRLMSIKELDFYLKNPDEYIRRLAILRLNELCLKESVGLLKDIMDEPYESQANKELAAWTIKVISLKHNTELFLYDKLLNRFSGSEKYSDIFRVNIKEYLPNIKFKFSTYLLDSQLKADDAGARLGEGIDLDIPFSIKEWLSTFSGEIISGLKQQLVMLPVKLAQKLAGMIKTILASIFLKYPKLLAEAFRQSVSRHKTSKTYGKSGNTGYFTEYKSRESFSSSVKKLAINILFALFFPVRFVIRHGKAFAVLTVLLYCFLTFSTPGRILLYNHYGIDLKEIQARLFFSGREFMAYAWDEFKDISGLSEAFADNSESQDKPRPDPDNTAGLTTSGGYYRVVAKNGLNLRTAPDASSRKVINESLSYNTIITYLSQSKKDSSGVEWYFVETSEGEKGWVSSKWIEKVEGQQYAGK